MSEQDELRGSAPIYSAKDVLLRLDGKIGEMDAKLDGALLSLAILVDQRLNSRVGDLESWRHSHEGRMIGFSAAIGAIAGAVTLGVAIAAGVVR